VTELQHSPTVEGYVYAAGPTVVVASSRRPTTGGRRRRAHRDGRPLVNSPKRCRPTKTPGGLSC
jgi:hypothetical protein